MGLPLLTFEDEFVDSMCGIDAASITKRWTDAFEDGRLALQDAVQARMRSNPATKQWADSVSVTLQGGSFVVVPPAGIEAELMAIELGDGTERPQAVLQGGVVRGASAAAQAITDGLDMP